MTLKPLIIIQNDPDVPPGTYADHLLAAGIPFRTISPFAGESPPPAEEAAAVIVLGGAMGVHDLEKHPFLAVVKRYIAETIEAGIPFLGICLGGQLLADVLQAHVASPSRHGEKGAMPVTVTAEGKLDPLFAGISPRFVTFQWHSDSFELPRNSRLLAASERCPHQAFRFGRCAYGLQFHPEVNRSIVENWCRQEGDKEAADDGILGAFAAVEKDYAEVSRRLLENFLVISGFLGSVGQSDSPSVAFQSCNPFQA